MTDAELTALAKETTRKLKDDVTYGPTWVEVIDAALRAVAAQQREEIVALIPKHVSPAMAEKLEDAIWAAAEPTR